jgi:XapX domain-containing protein
MSVWRLLTGGLLAGVVLGWVLGLLRVPRPAPTTSAGDAATVDLASPGDLVESAARAGLVDVAE